MYFLTKTRRCWVGKWRFLSWQEQHCQHGHGIVPLFPGNLSQPPPPPPPLYIREANGMEPEGNKDYKKNFTAGKRWVLALFHSLPTTPNHYWDIFSHSLLVHIKSQWTANMPGMGSSQQGAADGHAWAHGKIWHPHPKLISLNHQPGQLYTFLHKTLAFASSSGTKQEIYTFQTKFGDPRLTFLSENLLTLLNLYPIKMRRHLREAHSFVLNQEPSPAMIYITCSLPASISLTCDWEKYSIIWWIREDN